MSSSPAQSPSKSRVATLVGSSALRPGQRRGHPIVSRNHAISASIWTIIGLVFLCDISTPADDVSVCFAYLIPITISLFEATPRPQLYASATTTLSICGLVILPPNYATTVVMVAISITTQWGIAALVKLQHRRLVDANEKADSQRRFVDILSHEVGTALTTVSGQAYRLTKLSEQLAPEDLRARADKIRRAAERIQAIISRIQFASSLGDGSFPSSEGTVDLREVLEQLAEQMKEEHQGRHIEVRASAGPKHVTGDEMLLRQIFENVITNGIKYSPAPASVTVDVSQFGPSVRIVIADKGSGLSASELEHVRKPYYRGANSSGISGAGLGLYFVEKLVQAHQGHLALESTVGAGTTVTIDLPLAGAAVP